MTTTPPASPIMQIRADLDAIAPMPEDGDITAAGLARHFAVRAQQRCWRALNGSGDDGLDLAQLAAMCAEFAAAHALYALAGQSHAGPELGLGIEPAIHEQLRGCDPDDAAGQIRDAICDGSGIGEWLREHLGVTTLLRVSHLTDQLATAMAAAETDTTEAPAVPAGRLARVEVKGFRDLGVVRLTETTLAGEAMLHAERTEWPGTGFRGDAADFPASSVHFVTWLPDGWAPPAAPMALTAGDSSRDADYDEIERP